MKTSGMIVVERIMRTKGDADGSPVDDVRGNEGEQTDMASADCEGSWDYNFNVKGEWKEDNANTGFETDLGHVTTIPTLH